MKVYLNNLDKLTRKSIALSKVIKHCQSVISLKGCPDDSEIELSRALLNIVYKEIHKTRK